MIDRQTIRCRNDMRRLAFEELPDDRVVAYMVKNERVINEHTPFYRLGMDDIELAEYVNQLELRTGLAIPELTSRAWTVLGDPINYLCQHGRVPDELPAWAKPGTESAALV
jgi:hypothetical protein